MRSNGLKQFCQWHANLLDTTEKDASRRQFIAGMAAGVATTIAVGTTHQDEPATAVTPLASATETPIGPQWWPSPWGENDEAGASNWITPEKVLSVVKLIKTGKIYEMGHAAEASMPLFGDRGFLLRMVGSPTGGPFGSNQIVWNDEFLSTEIGQVGTCLDGLGHIGCQVGKEGDLTQMRYYNGFSQQEIAGPYGLKKLGIEKVKPFFTRGVLVDVQSWKGRRLEKGEEISLADVKASLTKQDIAINSFQAGDAIFFHTGWNQFWTENKAVYIDGEPGIGIEVARWIAEQKLCLVGADNWGVEVIPNPDPNLAFPCHHELITKQGIFIHEGMNFTTLLEDKVYEFVFILTPLSIKGATGSMVRPIAIA